MTEILIPLAFSFFTTLIFLPLNIFLAKKYKLIDNPKVRPHPAHIQNRIVPRAGGLACFVGILATVIFFIPNSTDPLFVGLLILTAISSIVYLLFVKRGKNVARFY